MLFEEESMLALGRENSVGKLEREMFGGQRMFNKKGLLKLLVRNSVGANPARVDDSSSSSSADPYV